MDQHRLGLWYGVAAYGIWGIAPAFWKLLDEVPALQLTAHRVIWSVPILAGAVLLLGRWGRLVAAARNRRTVLLTVAAGTLLATNWGVFVWAISADRIVEASLGYFMNPLLSVALGVVVLGERLRPAQTAAVALAAIGVAYMTIRLAELPWVSLVLAGTFALYGLIKKRSEAAPPLEGLLGETAFVMLPALAFVVAGTGGDGSFGDGIGTTLLLITAGAVTAAPLLLFGAAAQRIPLSMVGLLQYLAPTLQFVLGVAVYGETVAGHQLTGFAFVWLALVVFTIDNRRSPRTPAPAPGG